MVKPQDWTVLSQLVWPLRLAVRGYRKNRIMRRLKGPKIMAAFSRYYPRAFFAQIGANDGEQLDHLRNFVLKGSWSGIMVEPVPYVFERLEKNYGHLSNIKLVRLAIANQDGMLPFWHLAKADSSEKLPTWYDALGSFHKEVILKHKYAIPDIEERLVCTSVPGVTMNALFASNEVRSLDLLQIDTEGYDFEIIKLVDFEKYRPALMIYEHHHFDEELRRQCADYLITMGYLLYEEGLDTWCIDSRLEGEQAKFIQECRQLIPAWETRQQAAFV